MRSSMLEIKIKNIDSSVKTTVTITVEGEAYTIIEATQVKGNREIMVFFNTTIPSTVHRATIYADNDTMNEEQLQNCILDWLLTDEGTYAIRCAFDECKNILSKDV